MGNYRVSKCRNLGDAKECVEMYLLYAHQSPMNGLPEFSFDNAYNQLVSSIRVGKFFRILLNDSGEIVAWILCSKYHIPYFKDPVFFQEYYYSSLRGFSAFRALHMLHKEALREAASKALEFMVSGGSFLDEDNIFAKLLEVNGWARKGHFAYKETGYVKPAEK